VFRYLAGSKDIGLIFGSRNGDSVADSRGRDCLRLDVCCFADIFRGKPMDKGWRPCSGRSRGRSEVVIVQLDSLCKLEGADPYQIVLLDECESTLFHFP
jgi:hypothetical protein